MAFWSCMATGHSIRHVRPRLQPQIIPNTEVVVGDVMLVDTGDKIVADGIMVDGHHLVS